MKYALLMLSALPAIAFADVKSDLAKVDQTYSACMNKADSNVAMKECTYEAWQSADGVLNSSYREIVKNLKVKSGDKDSDAYQAETLKRLITSERAWITFRDAECELQGTEMLGGTGEGLVITGCLYDQTVQRVNQIQQDLSGGE